MFDGVADRYDRTNTFMSLGQDRRWRRHVTRALQPAPGQRLLDVAAGTAVSTRELAGTGAWCVAADFSLGMLRAGRHRAVPMVAADALALPFADASFDSVTITFGLRNVVEPAIALAEFARVTRPGGQLLVCEFSTPRRPFRLGYRWYRARAAPNGAPVLLEPRGVHLSRRDDQRLARPAGAREAHQRGRVDRRRLAQHDLRCGRAAPRDPRLTAEPSKGALTAERSKGALTAESSKGALTAEPSSGHWRRSRRTGTVRTGNRRRTLRGAVAGH